MATAPTTLLAQLLPNPDAPLLSRSQVQVSKAAKSGVSAPEGKPQRAAGTMAAANNPPPPDRDVTKCLSPEGLDVQDPHISRNAAALASSDLCIKMDEFHEGGLRWVLMIIQNKQDPDRFFWVVPHDNEEDAFDNAIAAVSRYRGTVVAVKTNGDHYNGLQDPNRNFDLGSGSKCGKQLAHSPIYTQRVMRWHAKGAPIVALHTNEQGYKGDGKGGLYGISMAQRTPGAVTLRATTTPIGASPDDTMVFVASLTKPDKDPGLMAFVNALRSQGVNAVYEVVTARHNDCSMSNYTTLKGMRDYVNIEVVRTDGATEAKIIDMVMNLIGDGSIRSAGTAASKPQPAGRDMEGRKLR